MKKALLVILLIGLIISMTACSVKSIADVKNSDLVGKKVTVRGEVTATIKLGSLSGYTLKDETGTISVSSESLPKEGETITVSGILVKDMLLGYYIKVN
jgi:uncharacterized protein YdeI (BOF family)